MSHSTTKQTKRTVCPAKTRISLGIRPVFAVPQLVAKDPRFPHADSEHSRSDGQLTDGQTRCLINDSFQQVVQGVEGKSEWKKK